MIRAPAVANLFYPGQEARLRSSVTSLLSGVDLERTAPKALIAPHAGYIYSGPIAATSFQALRKSATAIERVILIGPSHRVPFEGVALSSAEAFATPLGNVPLDKHAQARLAGLPNVTTFDLAHAPEHSLEVELPFLQLALPAFTLVPLLVGDADSAAVAEVLERLWGGPETLIVVSSDLSHFLDYDAARTLDTKTAASIEALDPGAIRPDQACGQIAINALLRLAHKFSLKANTLDLRNSGDTAGDKDQVVGYGAFHFQ